MPKRPSSRPSATSGRLRIVAGRLRGSRLDVPSSPGLRPTGDRVRETLFNWLAPVVQGMRCLDLFAGTGALGIEALSRGAAHCTFIERDRALAQGLEGNLERLDAGDARVVNADAATWLRAAQGMFDLVFIDPPFEAKLWNVAADGLETSGCLAVGAWLYVESPITEPLALPATWRIHREGQAGGVRHGLYRRAAPDPLS
ncbi:16S rRNA (guanine(966)-N(2))-methyltransferase RsmD [Dokdonella sp. MW10]|uniref:16S rRNA (guanine(966)-N(2))-methyltransferase RsmD n=1 Tax=Dokdonella sp. MW10 TaxID=2992926 RepID=UPI003F80D3E4